MMYAIYYSLVLSIVFTIQVSSSSSSSSSTDKDYEETAAVANTALAKLVKIFSKPGAFKQMDNLLGEDSIHETSTTCPEGEDGLECRRSEARKSVDCPHGDCYCSNCAVAGPQMWASCCRQGLRCCSHLAAACRTCDHAVLHPFCSKHFKKCINHNNDKKQN